ncbi:MAG: hypothetical protein WD696_04775 [Bryobacteraceae bacterium]
MIPATETLQSRAVEERAISASTTAKALGGLFLSGLLFALLGAILPAWQYHLTSDFVTVGNYFLALTAGVIASAQVARHLIPSKGVAFSFSLACLLACGALLFLAAVSPPASWLWRLLGILMVGFGAGLLRICAFQAIASRYQENPAATLNMAGLIFGSGCLMVTLLVAGTFYAYSVTGILILVALIPGVSAAIYLRTEFPGKPVAAAPSVKQTVQDFQKAGPLLLALLLFFQLGNEMSLAGWLPVFLVRRLGVSPETSLVLLALFWVALLGGRAVAITLLHRVSHGKLLIASALAAQFGCLLLLLTANAFGAAVSIALIGCGFASIYPLVAEKIRNRYAYFQPGFFNGIFSIGLCGGMLAPCVLGYAAAVWGCGVVAVLPLLGTCMVFVLVLLVWLHSKLTE